MYLLTLIVNLRATCFYSVFARRHDDTKYISTHAVHTDTNVLVACVCITVSATIFKTPLRYRSILFYLITIFFLSYTSLSHTDAVAKAYLFHGMAQISTLCRCVRSPEVSMKIIISSAIWSFRAIRMCKYPSYPPVYRTSANVSC